MTVELHAFGGSLQVPRTCGSPRSPLRQPGWLRESRGFASPPCDGYAFFGRVSRRRPYCIYCLSKRIRYCQWPV